MLTPTTTTLDLAGAAVGKLFQRFNGVVHGYCLAIDLPPAGANARGLPCFVVPNSAR